PRPTGDAGGVGETAGYSCHPRGCAQFRDTRRRHADQAGHDTAGTGAGISALYRTDRLDFVSQPAAPISAGRPILDSVAFQAQTLAAIAAWTNEQATCRNR